MTRQAEQPHLETLLVHGAPAETRTAGATLPPVVHSVGYAHGSAEDMESVFLHQQPGFVYSRLGNPTVQALEDRFVLACAGRGALAAASGMSATTLALLGLLRAGDAVLVSRYLFGGTHSLFDTTLRALGITPQFFDPCDVATARQALTPQTRAVFVEAIANPAILVPDFPALRGLCDETDLPLIVDATLLTPTLFDNAMLGADLAVFSTSKFIAGPASSLGGMVLDTGRLDWSACTGVDLGDYRRQGPHALLAKLRRQLMIGVGPSMSPSVAFLQLLGLETLGLRLERQCANAQAIAESLAGHPAVTAVQYPGLPAHPHHGRARELFRGHFGSVLSFTMASRAAAFRFLNRLALVQRVVNLGDTKTLAIHPASTIYSGLFPGQREEVGVPETMVRISAGIEHAGDILADIRQALVD